MGIMKAWILCMPSGHRPASGAGLGSWFLWNRSVISARPVPGRGRTARWFSACHGISTSGWCGPPPGWPSSWRAHLICAFVDPASYLTEWEPAGSGQAPRSILSPMSKPNSPPRQMLSRPRGRARPSRRGMVLQGAERGSSPGPGTAGGKRGCGSADSRRAAARADCPDGPAPGGFRQRFPDPPAGQARADRSAHGDVIRRPSLPWPGASAAARQ